MSLVIIIGVSAQETPATEPLSGITIPSTQAERVMGVYQRLVTLELVANEVVDVQYDDWEALRTYGIAQLNEALDLEAAFSSGLADDVTFSDEWRAEYATVNVAVWVDLDSRLLDNLVLENDADVDPSAVIEGSWWARVLRFTYRMIASAYGYTESDFTQVQGTAANSVADVVSLPWDHGMTDEERRDYMDQALGTGVGLISDVEAAAVLYVMRVHVWRRISEEERARVISVMRETDPDLADALEAWYAENP